MKSKTQKREEAIARMQAVIDVPQKASKGRPGMKDDVERVMNLTKAILLTQKKLKENRKW